MLFYMSILARFGVVAVALFSTAGCGKQVGKLSGTVKMDGRPVVSGSVLVTVKDGTGSAQGVISADGVYVVENVPYGELQIAVSSPDPGNAPGQKFNAEVTKKLESKGWKKPAAADNSKWFAIPMEYSGVETSGLTVTMDQKDKKHDIVLKAPPPLPE